MHVDEAATEDAVDERPFVLTLTDDAGSPFLRMASPVGTSDGDVTAQHERKRRRLEFRRVGIERFEKSHLRGKVLAAVGHVDRRERRQRKTRGDDALLVVERRMKEGRPLGTAGLSN